MTIQALSSLSFCVRASLMHEKFARLHGKLFHMLDEQAIRHRHELCQLPNSLLMTASAVSARKAFYPMIAIDLRAFPSLSSRFTFSLGQHIVQVRTLSQW